MTGTRRERYTIVIFNEGSDGFGSSEPEVVNSSDKSSSLGTICTICQRSFRTCCLIIILCWPEEVVVTSTLESSPLESTASSGQLSLHGVDGLRTATAATT
jgi:hypothetical protein